MQDEPHEIEPDDGSLEVPVEEVNSVLTDEEFEAGGPIDDARPPGDRRPLKFDKLRLDGFKSFPDRVEISIEPGMTGVVGPNGCGKSNLLEALRWVFGETSAKNMRGGAMDDVIFGGTERRPPRNVAEVSLVVDNRLRAAPVSMNDSDTLEIVRRIERGQGTSYRVNGKAARLRDMQILFQDLGSGARSSGIVSQGRVTTLINAKPSARRTVLEEAAGVSGLSARRHETELKLKQTEQNLARAEDALLQSSDLLSSLRRQAKQAQRRREIDGKVREALAGVLLIRHSLADRAEAKARAAHAANEERVAAAMIAVGERTRERDARIAALGALRDARAASETALAKAIARLESVANEAERSRRALDEAERRLVELAADRQRENESVTQGEAAIRKLAEERMVIAERRADEGVALEEASDAVENARRLVEEADALSNRLSAEMATREANHASALTKRDEARKKVDAVERRLEDSERRLAAAKAAAPRDDAMETAVAALVEAEARVEFINARMAEAEEALAKARTDDETARAATATLLAAASRARAEADGLAAADAGVDSRNPVSSRLAVEPGYEAAVASALGESLSAGTDTSERAAWTGKAPAVPPSLGRRLSAVVGGADEVRSALDAVILADGGLADYRTNGVPFGFIAVTADGEFVRWDGFAGRPRSGAVEAALKRANRLKALRAEIATIEASLAEARAGETSAATSLVSAREGDSRSRVEARLAMDAVGAARAALSTLEKSGEEARRRLAVAEAEVAGVRGERTHFMAALSEASNDLASIPPDDEAKSAHAAARRRLGEVREAESRSRVALERMIAEANQRRQRFDAVLREEADWTLRVNKSKARLAELREREDEAIRAREEAKSAPATSPEAIAIAREETDAAGAAAQAAGAALTEAEARREAEETALRVAEAALSTIREERARLMGAIEISQRERQAALQAIGERMPGPDGEPLKPGDLAAISGLDPAQVQDLSSAETKLSRLERERENLGEVNFLAESELAEQEKRYGDIQKSREELRLTVVKLRQAIGEIEREARSKLEDAFRRIDQNFGELFERLFSGGEAHLRLVDSEDILEAGLEIYCSPPGKRMQVLSLLSGGEQALTAMALIFAAFLSNPAPVCVLDEVDAPLDDANTDRLCRLVEAMTKNDATRFLVITHNPLTMAKMNRLFGVTMGERGVSSVTKVDLDKAIAIIEQS